MATIRYRGVTLPAGLSHDEVKAAMARIRAEMDRKEPEPEPIQHQGPVVVVSDTGWRRSFSTTPTHRVEYRDVTVQGTYQQAHDWVQNQFQDWHGQESQWSVTARFQNGYGLRLTRTIDSGD